MSLEIIRVDPSANIAMVQNLIKNPLNRIDGNGEAQALRHGDDGGIDPNKLATGIH